MEQCHKICLFLEDRVLFVMIYVKFNNHKNNRLFIVERPWQNENITLEKTFTNIFGVERRTHFKFPTIKENTNTHVWNKNHSSGSLWMQVSDF